ncbi:MAG: rhodanese-like domain-containing protein [Firmicutes bacterium]|nr:rhodanese-like domain-containing protein [Bacillota bacterium]
MFGFGPKIPELQAAELEQQLKGSPEIYVLDVRTLAEFRQGHIPGAHLVPVNELGHRMHEIPQDKTIVTVCRSGSRSRMAASQLQRAGYTVKNLSGGMLRWKGPVK